MKKITLLVAFIAFFVTASFAHSDIKSSTIHVAVLPKKGHTTFRIVSAQETSPNVKSCAVSVSFTTEGGKKVNLTVEVNCENCTTTQEACDLAYKALSLAIPG